MESLIKGTENYQAVAKKEEIDIDFLWIHEEIKHRRLPLYYQGALFKFLY